jgi:hypothetical protein
VIGVEEEFDPEKCQKEIFAPLPAVLLAGLLTRLSRMKTRPLCFSQMNCLDLGERYWRKQRSENHIPKLLEGCRLRFNSSNSR